MKNSNNWIRCPAGYLVEVTKTEVKNKQTDQAGIKNQSNNYIMLVSGLLFSGILFLVTIFALLVFAI